MNKVAPEPLPSTMEQLFPEHICYHSFEERCNNQVYDRIVKYPFCLKHRCYYAQMNGLLDFQTIPLTEEQQSYLLKNLEAVRLDFQFELKQYKRFRPTGTEKKNLVFEYILNQKYNTTPQDAVETSNTNIFTEVGPFPYNENEQVRAANEPQQIWGNVQLFDERPIHADSQNVHRTEIRIAQNPMLFDLLRTHVTEVNSDNLIKDMKQCILNNFIEKTNTFGKIWYSFVGTSLSASVRLFEVNLRVQMKVR